MIRAAWNGAVLAESDRTVVIEGNHYFRLADVHEEYLQDSSTHTRRPWKGLASYYTVVVDGKANRDAAWYYLDPSQAAAAIKGHIALWRGVRVTKVSGDDDHETRPSLVSRLLHR